MAKKAPKKKPGRPPLSGESMNERFWFRCSKTQLQMLEKAALLIQEDPGTWGRQTLVDKARRIIAENS